MGSPEPPELPDYADITPAQLETARRVDAELGLGIELVEANAEEKKWPSEEIWRARKVG